jgi:two-component system, OmpR family, sensor histidine kinase KdpD
MGAVMLMDQRSGTYPTEPGAGQDGGLSSAQSRRLRSTLLDSISRDVARPLALIAGAAESLRKRSGSSDGTVRSELIEVIESETERVERFASILLDLAKLESDGVDLRSEPVTLKDVVGVALKDTAKTLRDRKTTMSVPANLPALRLDSSVLRRVLTILIENAARQSPPGATVGIHAGSDGKAIRLQILDEGEGIPPPELTRLFGQLHLPCGEDQNHGCAGMDLVVCRGYIEAMGGTITGSNRTDRSGAVFTITFPVAS